MSKKIKKYKKPQQTVPAKPSDSKLGASSSPPVKNKPVQSFLIAFDKRAKIFLLILISAYVILSLLKIHTSNIGNWDLFFGKQESESVISGKPRFIRMDEWMVNTPSTISQYQQGLPIKNQAIGAENAPVVMGLPIKDISSLFRPSIWSYFIFDEERAFAFAWNFNIFICIISFFLLFMLLTRNNFWLSVFGSLFLFFSSAVQWWSYSIGYQMMYLNGMLISFIYILYSRRLWSLVLAGVFFLFSVTSFLFVLYPAFQVPLIYLYLAIFIGYLWQRKNFQSIREKFLLRTAVFSVVVLILGFFLYHYYHLVKETYTVMLNTVYPGKRFSTGGKLIDGKFFSDFFGMYMSDTHLPKQWQNICEESGFIIVFPIIFYAIGHQYFKTKQVDPLLLLLSVYVIVGSLYVLVGFPAFLSKLSLLSMSPDYRALPIFEGGNAVLLICYLGNKQTDQRPAKFSWTEFGILAVSIIVFVRIVCSHINIATENFFTSEQVNIVTFLVTAAYLLIRYKQYRFSKPALYVTLAIMILPNLSVNPVTSGLSAANENPLVQISKEIHDKDPKARWAVFSKDDGWQGPRITQALNFNGISALNGVKFVPPIKEMRVLDPSGQYDSAYNRYAWVIMRTFIAGKDSVVIRQMASDGYVIFIDPCSPRLKELGVKYITFIYKPEDFEVRCLTKVGETSGLFIYKRNDE